MPGILLLLMMLFSSLLPIPTLAADWKLADTQRAWSFPADHGSHEAYRTEWWYFTGNLISPAKERYGFELTFFREGIRPETPDPENPWSVRNLYVAHFALTDVAKGKFYFKEQASRAGPGLAGASAGRMNLWNLNWTAFTKGGVIHLNAADGAMALKLALRPAKPVVLHGERGLSRKGGQRGQASYYASFTDLHTTGSLSLPGRGEVPVEGTSWFDHEFGSSYLSGDQQGWDWFGLHLSDGHDLMFYLLRRKDGSPDPASSGTLVEPSGASRNLSLSDISLEVLDHWKSGTTKAVYPSRWRIRLKEREITMIVTPLLNGQELDTAATTGIVYWEGAVSGEGTSGGRKITCEGYAEMTGYAGSLGGKF